MALTMSAERAYRMIRKSVAMRGAAGTIGYAMRWPFVILSERRDLRARNDRQAQFDEAYGTDTGGVIPLSEFTIDHPNWVHGVRYAPTSLETFTGALALLGLSSFEPFTFVDVGSGKGATLLYAADLGFREVLGIELVPELNDIAIRNLSLYPPARGKGASVCADATTYEMPSTPLIAFFNYPFSSKELMDSVIGNIRRCGKGLKYLIAINYPYDPATLPGGGLKLIGRIPRKQRCNYAFEVL
jgi:SAM-dependent methyltransferase